MASEQEELELLRLRKRKAETQSALADLKDPNALDYEKLTYAPTVGMGPLSRGVAAYAGAVPRAARSIGNMVGLVSDEENKSANELDKPLRETTAGKVGDFLGNTAMAAPLAMAPGANTILGSAGYGAAFGLTQPADTTMDRIKNVVLGGAGAGAVTGAVKGIPAIWNAMGAPFTKGGQEKIALDAIGRFAQDKGALSKVRGSGELIPGSTPTLAEVTGDPGIAQLQRSATAASPETASLMANNKTARMQARKDALGGISGTHDDRQFFEAARDATAQRLYGDAFKTPITPKRMEAVSGDIQDLLSRPSIQSAKADALKLAKEAGDVVSPEDLEGGSLQGLHYMKLAIDGQISAAKQQGNNNLARLLVGTQDKLVGVMQKISPKYASAMAQYQADSKPINQMEIGKYLYEKLVPSLSDLGAERITPSQYAKALSEGDEMARKATGFKGAKLADILTTDQMNTLINLGVDLGREAGATARGMVPGSQTAQYLAGSNAMRQIMGPVGMPQSWGESLLAKTIGGRAISAVASPVENKVQQTLGRFLVSPTEAQAAQQALSQRNMRMLPLSRVQDALLPPVSITAGSAYANQ